MKKLTLSSDDLKRALKKLSLAVSAKSILPALSNLYCRITAGQLEMITSDLELTISAQLKAETKGEFEMLIPFKFFNDLIGQLKSVPVEIELVSSKQVVLRESGNDFKINAIEKTDSFAKIPSEPKKNLMALNDQFIKLLTTGLDSVGKDENRPAMTAVCLDMNENETTMVSTDAHIMYTHKLQMEVKEKEQLLFSAKLVHAIDGLKEIQLAWTKERIAIKGGEFTMWGKRIDAAYPNYRVVIPDTPANLTVNKAELSDALNKACLSSVSTKQTDLYLRKEAGKIHLEFYDKDNDRNGHIIVPAEYNGATEIISVSAKKLLTVLGQVEAETVKLHIASSKKAILVSCEENKEYLGLIMPLMNE